MQIVPEAIKKEIALKVSSNHSNWNKIQSTLRLIPHSEDENNANTFHAEKDLKYCPAQPKTGQGIQ